MFTKHQRRLVSQQSSKRGFQESQQQAQAREHLQQVTAMASAPDESWDLNPKAPPPSAPPPPPPPSSSTPIATAVPVPITNVNSGGKSNSYAIVGRNKKLRDRVKLILTSTCICLFLNQNGWALLTSVVALITLKKGTLFSHKNWKWGTLCVISVVVSAAGYMWNRSEHHIDENRAYHMKLITWILANWLSGFWGIILGLFLVSALYNPEQVEKLVAEHLPNSPLGKLKPTVQAPPPSQAAVTGLAPAVPDWSYHHKQQ